MTASARREQLLEIAARIVAERGFAGVSMQAVAMRAGVSRPVVYEHFRTLQGLFEALVEREVERAREQLSEAGLGDVGDGDPIELMLESLGIYLQAVAANPGTWRLLLVPLEGAPPLLHKTLLRGRASVQSCIADAIHAGGLPGRNSDPELTERMLSWIVDEYARLAITQPRRYPPERMMLHAGWWLSQMFG